MLLAPEGYSDRMASTTDFSKDDTGSANARYELTKDAFRQSLEHPLGIGLGMNSLLQAEEHGSWSTVHNVYLQIATELGIISAIVFIVLLWKLIAGMRRISSSPKAADGRLALLAEATEVSLVAFAVGGVFHPVAYNFSFYIIAGIAVAVKEIAGRFSQDMNTAVAPTMTPYHVPQFTPTTGSIQFQREQNWHRIWQIPK